MGLDLGKCEDLTGQAFNRLTVTGFAGRNKRGCPLWDCVCTCGNLVLGKVAGDIKQGNTKSCGCLKREKTVGRNTTHGLSGAPEYVVWAGMIARCSNPNHSGWGRYGGRGVTVCNEWLTSFETFYADMGQRPSPEHSVERKANDEGYSASNCFWATKVEQANNTSANVLLTCLGETKTMAQWCLERGLSYPAVRARKERGWSDEDALTKPVRHLKTIMMSYAGQEKTLIQWCAELGLNYRTVQARKDRGWSDEDALTKPVQKQTYQHAA